MKKIIILTLIYIGLIFVNTSYATYNLNTAEKAKGDLVISKLDTATIKRKGDKVKFQAKYITALNKLKAKSKNEQLKSLIDYIVVGFGSKNYSVKENIITNINSEKVNNCSFIPFTYYKDQSDIISGSFDFYSGIKVDMGDINISNIYNSILGDLVEGMSPGIDDAILAKDGSLYYVTREKKSGNGNNGFVSGISRVRDWMNPKEYITKDGIQVSENYDRILSLNYINGDIYSSALYQYSRYEYGYFFLKNGVEINEKFYSSISDLKIKDGNTGYSYIASIYSKWAVTEGGINKFAPKYFIVIDGIEGKKYDEIKGIYYRKNNAVSFYVAKENGKFFIVKDKKEGKKYDKLKDLITDFNNTSDFKINTYEIIKDFGQYYILVNDDKKIGFEEGGFGSISDLYISNNTEHYIFKDGDNRIIIDGVVSEIPLGYYDQLRYEIDYGTINLGTDSDKIEILKYRNGDYRYIKKDNGKYIFVNKGINKEINDIPNNKYFIKVGLKYICKF